MTLLNHLILILLSLTTSFSIFAYIRYRPYKAKPQILFYDNFNDDLEWKNYGDGEIAKSEELVGVESTVLKRTKKHIPMVVTE